MAKRADLFSSRYMKAPDLGGEPRVYTIKKAPIEPLRAPDGGREQEKVVLYFTETEKVLALNLVNFDSCADACGEDTDDWPGHSIELFPDKTMMNGNRVDCIRIRAPSGDLPLRPPKAAAAQTAASNLDDEIQF